MTYIFHQWKRTLIGRLISDFQFWSLIAAVCRVIATDISLSRLYIVDASINESRESICERGLFRGGVRSDRERRNEWRDTAKAVRHLSIDRRRNVDLVNHMAGPFSHIKQRSRISEPGGKVSANCSQVVLANGGGATRGALAVFQDWHARRAPLYRESVSPRNCERSTLDASGFSNEEKKRKRWKWMITRRYFSIFSPSSIY